MTVNRVLIVASFFHAVRNGFAANAASAEMEGHDSQMPVDEPLCLMQKHQRMKIYSFEDDGLNQVSMWNPGPPTAAVLPPGNCVFNDTWTSSKMLSKENIDHDTRLFTFELADSEKPLGLCTCACIMMSGVGREAPVDKEGNAVARPYTPVSTNAMLGKFELMIKIYPDGELTSYLDKLKVGDSVQFKHIDPNVKIQYPFKKSSIGMIVGGTGITPMIQALHAILGTSGDKTKVSMLYASKTEDDILAKDILDSWASDFADRLTVVHVLSREPEDSKWKGLRGHINKTIMEKYLPKPSSESIIFVCGPESHTSEPGFYDTFSGPRDEDDVKGLLGDMGYDSKQVYKF